MKRIGEMDEKELLSLNDADVMRLIDYECALEGVPMLPPAPGFKPQKDLSAPDTTTFEIAGFLTTSSEHASMILEALLAGPLFKEGYAQNDYYTRYLSPLDDYQKPKVESKRIYSPGLWDQIKNQATIYATAKAEWEAIEKEYSEALKARSAITEKVYGYIEDARKQDRERTQIRADFARYLELAEGSRQIALNFLEKVKDLSNFPELREEFLHTN